VRTTVKPPSRREPYLLEKMGRSSWLVASVLLLSTTACGAGSKAPSESGPSPSSAAVSESRFPEIDDEDALAMATPLRFDAADGSRLEGLLFGTGDVGVVLAHMLRGDQTQWLEFAAFLATEGYRVLTFNSRGTCPGGPYGCSRGTGSGDDWQDLQPAVDVVRAAGSNRVVVGGASIGAMKSLYALGRGLDADGLIWVSGFDFYGLVPVRRQVRDVTVPKLFIAGEYDTDAAALLPVFERVAPDPKLIVSLDTGEHGTDIVRFADPAVADQLRGAVLDFLEDI